MSEISDMNVLIDKVHQWGVDRKIIGNGKLETQWLKLLSEFGEMCDNLADGKDPIDDIGDQIVVIIMMAGIKGKVDAVKEMMPWEFAGERDNISAVQALSGVYPFLLYPFHLYALEACLEWLCIIANNHNLTLLQCLQHAYDEIKDRKGYLNENGVFIKETA